MIIPITKSLSPPTINKHLPPVRVPGIPSPTSDDDFGNMTEEEIRLYLVFVARTPSPHKYKMKMKMTFFEGMTEEQNITGEHVVARVQSPSTNSYFFSQDRNLPQIPVIPIHQNPVINSPRIPIMPHPKSPKVQIPIAHVLYPTLRTPSGIALPVIPLLGNYPLINK